MNNQLLALPEVKELTGISKSTIYKWMKLGDFPKCVKVTPGPNGKSVWKLKELTEWQDKLERYNGI